MKQNPVRWGGLFVARYPEAACRRGQHWYATRAARLSLWLTTSGATPAYAPGVAGVCHARGRPMTPPNSIKMIALITLLIGVALLLAALLY